MNIITDWIEEVRESFILAELLEVLDRNGVEPIILGWKTIDEDEV